MSRDAVLSAVEDERSRATCPPVFMSMEPLTPMEIERLVAACNDSDNNAARNLFAYSGAQTVTGIIARLTIATPEMRAVLHVLIHRAIAEHQMKAGE